MSCILHIETSTSACSVAISNEGENVFEQKDLKGPSHNVSLGVFVDEAISFATTLYQLFIERDIAKMHSYLTDQNKETEKSEEK